uniref:Uncharacterized protein n=1 Tax=Molossus molossus TaxID=27622 RepID=A0A7J8DPJ7_MOLMO|nr:hypothetical protein HJG59_009222 [Molossus molossus]
MALNATLNFRASVVVTTETGRPPRAARLSGPSVLIWVPSQPSSGLCPHLLPSPLSVLLQTLTSQPAPFKPFLVSSPTSRPSRSLVHGPVFLTNRAFRLGGLHLLDHQSVGPFLSPSMIPEPGTVSPRPEHVFH